MIEPLLDTIEAAHEVKSLDRKGRWIAGIAITLFFLGLVALVCMP